MALDSLALEIIWSQYWRPLLVIKAVTSSQGKGRRPYHLVGGMPKKWSLLKNHYKKKANKLYVIYPIGIVLQLDLSSAGGLLQTVQKTSSNCPQGS